MRETIEAGALSAQAIRFVIISNLHMMWQYYARRLLLKSRALIPGLRKQYLREVMVGPLGHWATLQAYQLEALRANGLEPRHYVLDIGCGPLQGGIAMINHLEPSRYFGVDVDGIKLAEGYRQVANYRLTHKNPRLIHSATFGVEHIEGLSFDFIWASQILYYFDEDMLRSLFRFIADKLSVRGKFLGDILGTCDPMLRSRTHLAWCRSVETHSLERFEGLAQPMGLQVRPLGRISAFGYPKLLSLCSNVLVEVTRKDSPLDAHRAHSPLGLLNSLPQPVATTTKPISSAPSIASVE